MKTKLKSLLIALPFLSLGAHSQNSISITSSNVNVSNPADLTVKQTAFANMKMLFAPSNEQNPNFSGNYCKSHSLTKEYFQGVGVDLNTIDYQQQIQEILARRAENRMASGPIPIIFHVVYNTSQENVSNATIQMIFEQINLDFQAQNTDYPTTHTNNYGFTIGNPDITFCLAQQDPQGNQLAEPGVERTFTNEIYYNPNTESNKMKYSAQGGADIWNRDSYLNVWICDITDGAMSGTAGYAYVPQYFSGQWYLPDPNEDGIVIDYNLGTYDGRTLTHELGHYFGLSHTWESISGSGGCGDDDGLTDTPNTAGPSFNYSGSCSGNQTTCSGIQTQYENHMDYSNCAIMFTPEQSTLMNDVLQNGRSSLLSSTGCNAATPPTCGIDASASTVGEGGSITFNDGSTNATSWSWDFDQTNNGGATPSTSTSENPGAVSFVNQGTYTVELTVTNSVGSTTCTQDIIVTPPTCGIDASNTTVVQNGSVTFNNASDPGTTAWDWNFDITSNGGATPATSNAENPGAVTFGNLGTYTVELITQFSTPCTTSVNINVIASQGCDTLLNIAATDTLTMYGDGAGGIVTGWNQYGDLAKVEKYTGYSPNTHVNGAAIYFDYATDGGNSATVDLVVYNDNGSGLPGTLLGTSTYNLSDIATALNGAGGVLNLTFDGPVDITSGTFYIGTYFNGFGTGDMIGIYQNSLFDPTPNSAYELWNDGNGNPNGWSSMTDGWYGPDFPFSLYISPYVTDAPVSGTAASDVSTTCVGSTINFSATGNNSVGYNWFFSGGTPSSSTNQNETVTYPTAGNYTAYLVLDGACSGQATDSVEIIITAGPTATASATDPGCAGNDGQIVIAATGGSGPYTYSVDGGSTFQSGDTFTGLTDGSYDIVAEDVNGCQGIFTAVLNPGSGTLPVSASTTDPGCANNDGQIVVSAAGGTGPYTFSIDGGSNFQSVDTFTGLAANTYNVVSEDANGCQGTTTATLTLVGLTLTVNSTINNPSCGANDGSIVTSVSGGSGPYAFSNDGGITFSSGTNPYTFASLGTGSYNIVVQDANTCQGTETVTLNNPTAPTETSTSSNTTCISSVDGSITTVANGTAPFSFSIDGGITFTSGPSPFTTTGLSPGTYNVVVQDAAGCTSAASSITITAPTAVVHTTSVTNASCGANNGTITVVATGGTAPYTYSIDNGGGYQSSASFTGLAANTYQIIVMDANGCTSMVNTEMITGTGTVSTAAAAVNETCAAANGSIVLTGTGGSAPYQYSIDGGATFQSSGIFTGLSAGTYNVVIEDVNGCQGANTSTITNTGGFTPTISSNQTICFGNSTTITSGGAGSGGTYTWDGGLGTGATQVVSPATTTTYTVIMEDFSECTETASVTITVETEPIVTITPSNPVICDGESVTLIGSGAQTYNWNNGATSASITVSPTNQTTYTVIGSNGVCQGAAVSTTISVNLAPVVIAGSDQTLIVAGGTINFSNAGSGATSYSWSFGDGTSSTLGSPSHTFTTAGTYTVILTGTLGNCSSSDTITINVGFTGLEEINLEESVNLYPNPSNGEFNLSINFAVKQDVEIRVFNTIGELLASRRMNDTSSSFVKFNLNNNAEGFYFVNIKTNNQSITKRISIIR